MCTAVVGGQMTMVLPWMAQGGWHLRLLLMVLGMGGMALVLYLCGQQVMVADMVTAVTVMVMQSVLLQFQWVLPVSMIKNHGIWKCALPHSHQPIAVVELVKSRLLQLTYDERVQIDTLALVHLLH